MNATSFQCPDSGLIVHVSKTAKGWVAEGDEDDWSDMDASSSDVDNTKAWIEAVNRALRGCKSREDVERVLTSRQFGVDGDDLDMLWW